MTDTAPGAIPEAPVLLEVPAVDPLAPPAPAAKKRTRRPRKAAATVSSSSPVDKAPRPPGRPSNKVKLADGLTDTITTIGVFVAPFNQADGLAIIEGAAPLGDSLAKLAETSPAVKASLERLLTGSAWGAVLVAVAGIAVPIAANHGLLPGGFLPTAGGPEAGAAGGPFAGLDLSGIDLEAMAAKLAGDMLNGTGAAPAGRG